MAHSLSLCPSPLPPPHHLHSSSFHPLKPNHLHRHLNLHCHSLKSSPNKNPFSPKYSYASPITSYNPKLLWGIFANTWWADLKGAFGQRFNLEGIICSTTILSRDRHMLLPHVTVPDLRWIDWSELRRRGFKAVVFDKDNTLTLPYVLTLWDPLKPGLDRCMSVFGENNVAVFSNSAGLTEFDPDESKAMAVETAIGLRVIRHKVKKPAGDAGEIETQLGFRSREVVMVGDRRFTDIVYGNRNGFFTVLTEPLGDKGEPFVVKVIRRVELFLVRKWWSKGLRPIEHSLLPCNETHLICLDEPTS